MLFAAVSPCRCTRRGKAPSLWWLKVCAGPQGQGWQGLHTLSPPRPRSFPSSRAPLLQAPILRGSPRNQSQDNHHRRANRNLNPPLATAPRIRRRCLKSRCTMGASSMRDWALTFRRPSARRLIAIDGTCCLAPCPWGLADEGGRACQPRSPTRMSEVGMNHI